MKRRLVVLLLIALGIALMLGILFKQRLLFFSTNSSFRLNPNLLTYQNLQIGDYFIYTDEDGFSNLSFVVQAMENMTLTNDITTLKTLIAPSKELTLALGDGSDRVFFAKYKQTDRYSNLPFISKKVSDLDQKIQGKTFVFTIPLKTNALEQYAKSNECTDYCQKNFEKVSKYDASYLETLISGKSLLIFDKLKKPQIIGPVVQILEIE